MLPEGSIRSDRLWKRFRADRQRSLFRDEVKRLADRIKGRGGGWRWALQDITFDIEPGEAIGLIGANGSGKSTLLKIVARVMYPYAGSIETAGRIGALIEVRAGIHSELTGRENIYLYGSLLGLPRKQVAARFDQIVSFAELDEAVDRQVKFYSSGMQMRLGFSVAAFLEPAILLVDEVLAVGDASFQQKCLDRMREVLQTGTTLVFVSHDLAAVEATCARGLWLDRGILRADASVTEAVSAYRRSIEEQAAQGVAAEGPISLMKAAVESVDGGLIRTQEPLTFRLVVQSDEMAPAKIYLGVSEGPAGPIFSVHKELKLAEGNTEIRCRIESLPLPRGRYYLWVGLQRPRKRGDALPWHPATQFDVSGPDLDPAPRAVVRAAPVHVVSEWDVSES